MTTWNQTSTGRVVCGLLTFVLTGCGSSAALPALTLGAECVAVDGGLASGATLADMAGEYRLVMVAPAAPERRTEGTLLLRATPAELSRWGESATILYGSTTIDVEAVGAHEVGVLTSDQPAAPGVLVMESGTADLRRVSLRLGSEANQRDIVRFDGAYTVLWVRAIADVGFAGGWTSGAGNEEVEGYFCAQRRAE